MLNQTRKMLKHAIKVLNHASNVKHANNMLAMFFKHSDQALSSLHQTLLI